jgi:5-(carboxyamino)imidazole ribonucleotide synthase
VADVLSAGEQLGWPVIIKTCRSGYDGKGQAVVASAAHAAEALSSLQTDDAIAEQRIDFVAEVSLLVARNARGQVVTYPLIENSHSRHILDVSRCPVSPELLPLETSAREIATGIAQQFEVEGLFCVEFFVDARRGLLINEIAPRPHNSGHLTIEAFGASQFEQQLRAVCNLPLAPTTEYRSAAMANLLGDLWFQADDQALAGAAHSTTPRRPEWEHIFATPGAYLHLYGKTQPRLARKMGHLTCIADTAEEAVKRVQYLRQRLTHSV